MTAFLAPRRDLMRRNCARRYVAFTRIADQAAVTSVVLSHVPDLRTRVLRRLPALSSLRGHKPAHEMRFPGVENRVMSVPISATITLATTSLTPGIVVSN